MIDEYRCLWIKRIAFCSAILMAALLCGCGTFQRSGEGTRGYGEGGDRGGAILEDDALLRIVERVGYYNGKLASPGLASPDVEAVYRGRRDFWLKLSDLTWHGGYAIGSEIVDLLVREDGHLTGTLIDLIGEGEGLYSPGIADSAGGAGGDMGRLVRMLDRKESSLYLLAWEIERLRGLLSQAGIDLEEDSYIESLTVDEIVSGLTWEELLHRLRESEHASGAATAPDLEQILYGDIASGAHTPDDEREGDTLPGESGQGETAAPFGTAGSGDGSGGRFEPDSLSLSGTHGTLEDSLAAREDAIYAIVEGLMDDYEYRLAYDLVVSSFEDDIPPRFLEQMEIAAGEDIAQGRKEAADLYLEGRDLASARPLESLNLMRQSVALLDELHSRYPDHPRTALVRTNRESILKKLEEVEPRISIDAPR